ncbi:MAG TPA: hypothetical protein VN634_00745 [Candidatus Limnocylindrales bacterium]|jgi:hypothetical protein|nr:hypothetical protein [Candidatus Limnocylindrales bacterium]
MKIQSLASILSFGLLLGSLVATTSSADETVTTTTKTTTYSGIVSQIDPTASTIILKSESSPEPTTYSFTKETTFVDPTGRVVSYESMRNAPVTVEYTNDGGRMVVRKVIQTGPAVVVPAQPQVQKRVTETRTVHED